jgi:MoaA/NifB/PqqE/SkfB family radical SAM enzyme
MTTKNLVAVEDNYPPKDDWLRIEWNMGRRCNYDCSYCGSDIHDRTSSHLDLKVIDNTVKQIAGVAKMQDKDVRISLTGGEPFVHPNIIEVLKIIKNNGINKISVTTNGSVPLKKYIESLPYIDYYIFSYHFEFAYHDKIINTIVELNKLVKQTANQHLHVHLMYLPGKIDQANEIIDIMNENDVNWVIRRIRPRIDPVTNTWAVPGTSGLKTVHGKSKDVYYTDEELDFMLNRKK